MAGMTSGTCCRPCNMGIAREKIRNVAKKQRGKNGKYLNMVRHGIAVMHPVKVRVIFRFVDFECMIPNSPEISNRFSRMPIALQYKPKHFEI